MNGTHCYADSLFYQLYAQILYFNIFYYTQLHVSSTIMLIVRRIIVLVQRLVSPLSLGDCSVHRLREDSVTVFTVSGINETVTATCRERDWMGHAHDRWQYELLMMGGNTTRNM